MRSMQGAAAQEISRNVQQAAHGTHQVLSAARMLSTDNDRLKREGGMFLDTVRAA